METGYIKFADIGTDNLSIDFRLVDGTVWMTVNEIADLFGVYTPLINKNLKAIFKDNLSRENEVMKEYRYTQNEKEERQQDIIVVFNSNKEKSSFKILN